MRCWVAGKFEVNKLSTFETFFCFQDGEQRALVQTHGSQFKVTLTSHLLIKQLARQDCALLSLEVDLFLIQIRSCVQVKVCDFARFVDDNLNHFRR